MIKQLCLLIFLVVIYTTSGNSQISFQNTYGGVYDEEALCIQQTVDQGYVLAGYSGPKRMQQRHAAFPPQVGVA